MNAPRVRVAGKQFVLDGEPFRFRGVTYGTFRRRADGALFPPTARVETDLRAIRAAGFTVVRTYTVPPDDVLELAAASGLRVLTDVFYPDWRYLLGHDRPGLRRVAADARQAVRRAARRLAGCGSVLGLSLGNEIPADVLRWYGTDRIADLLDELAGIVREQDPGMPITYGNYPTTEYLSLPALDFVTFNVFLEQPAPFRRYLTRLHHLAGDRPVVLGEIGCDAGDDEGRQAAMVDWMLGTALERGIAGTCLFSWTDEWWVNGRPVEGWHFGLTRSDRSPRPALEVASRWNARGVADLPVQWPTISVVVCAYNAEATLDECLRHTCALDYPRLEVIVVDDGSTDATADIARRHERVQLVSIGHAGLSVARNEGLRTATGDLVAYLDSDAYPTPEWPYHLALGLDDDSVGGVGGPNVPPPDDPRGSQVVARSPGGPVHVLLRDDRAEHIPGCNMAFRREVLEEVGGFDPVYTAAGDDVDLCWRVLDRGWDIAFHPAALVWHHRRPGLRAYLRQQAGYGRAEALVEARHPDRFTPLGAATWRGRIYNPLVAGSGRQRIYRGPFGTAPYQSVYRAGGHLLDLVHQAGLPLAVLLLLTAPLGLVHPALALPGLLGALTIASVGTVDLLRTDPPRDPDGRPWSFRAAVVVHHLLQPLVRHWARWRQARGAGNGLSEAGPLPQPVRRLSRGVWLLPRERPRGELVTGLVRALRRNGIRVHPAVTGWDDHDARWNASTVLRAELVSSAHPEGFVHVGVRLRPRPLLWLLALAGGALVVLDPRLAAVAGLLLAAEVGRGWWGARHDVGTALSAGMHREDGESASAALRPGPRTAEPPSVPTGSPVGITEEAG